MRSSFTRFSLHPDKWIGIGQCIGARNHKYFVNFCILTALFTLYTFVTLLACTRSSTTAKDSSHKLNWHTIIAIIMSAFFCPFTGHLLFKHVEHILYGQTLVERMYMLRIQKKEEEALSNVFSWWEFEWAAFLLLLNFLI